MSTGESYDPQTTAWRNRLTQLGLDPDRDAVNQPILTHTRSLDEYKGWLAFPEQPAAATNEIKAEKIAEVPDALLRRYVTDHVTNHKIINNPDTIKALEERVGRFFLLVTAAPDITITGANPLIVNSTGTITVYNNVTIRDGGYIKMLVPAKFECQTLTKIQGAGSAAYDVMVAGADGTDDTAGNSPKQPAQTAKGDNAACDCCGGLVSRNAQNGAPGTDGDDGDDAQGAATDGGPAPQAFFQIAATLTGTVSFLHQGGRGGNGGDGGTGAQGGKGGNGGDGRTCVAYHPSGAQGGTGGKGGNGGNGSNGRNGGSGGSLAITVPASATTNILVTNSPSESGRKGNRGMRGPGGPGGDAGANGGTTGAIGAFGDTDGQDGQPGQQGSKGSSTLNGVPVG